VHNKRAAAILATEIAVFYFALASWRSHPLVPAGARAITHHRRSGHAGMVIAFILVMAVEGIAVHMILQTWSALAAWIFTAANAYGALWLIADFRLTVLRPVLVLDDRIVVRAGLRGGLTVPRARITAVGRTNPHAGKASVNLTFFGTPTHWLQFAEPVVFEGPYGFSKPVRAIGFEPDAHNELDRLERLLEKLDR
jgi:hypothetical protein